MDKVTALETMQFNETILCYSADDIYDNVRALLDAFINHYSKRKHCPEVEILGTSAPSNRRRILFHAERYAKQGKTWEFVETSDTNDFTVDHDTWCQTGNRELYREVIQDELKKYKIPPTDLRELIIFKVNLKTKAKTITKSLVLHRSAYPGSIT